MVSRKAWVITCLVHDLTLAIPDVVSGAPLIMLPGRTARERIEGAMIAASQLLTSSNPSVMVRALRPPRAEQAEWDHLGLSARLGLNPQILAHHATLRYRQNSTTEEVTEVVSYSFSPWVTHHEIKTLAMQMEADSSVDLTQGFDDARRQLRRHTRTWSRRN